ncbi:MAG TPA: hypothetical protein VHJ17_24000 [Thermomonospora sp.]|nr:hypothetical protein [Thermomonospora sp.]
MARVPTIGGPSLPGRRPSGPPEPAEDDEEAPPAPSPDGDLTAQPTRLRDLPLAAWPVGLLLVGYPLWWLLGIGVFSFIIFAVPMALGLLTRRPLRLPPGFGLWLLFLLWYIASLSMLTENPPGAYGEFGFGRIVTVALRLAVYLSVAIIVLYVGNLSERELPRLALVRMMGALFVTTTLGGLLGVLWPDFTITAPFELLLPGRLRGDEFVQNIVSPTAAQIQWVGSFKAIRPEAPFEWANTWGNNFSILLIWFVIGWWVYGSRRRRVMCAVLLAVALVPVIYGLNRGLWVGIAACAVYVTVRMALRGRTVAIAALAVGVVVGGGLFVVSPLYGVVQERLNNPHSDGIRAYTRNKTIEASLTSPIIGYGTTRYAVGSDKTAVTGKTSSCPECKHPPLGADGQLWLLLISQGLVGAGLYVLFFLRMLLRYRRDQSPIAIGGVLAMGLVLFYSTIYDGLYTPLPLYMLSFALLWRNEMALNPSPKEQVALRARELAAKARVAARERRIREARLRGAAPGRAPGTPAVNGRPKDEDTLL